MKKKLRFFFLCVTILIAAVVYGQHVPEKAGSIEDGQLVLKINLQWSQEQKARLAEQYDLDSLLVNAINSKNFAFINDSTEWTATLSRQGMLILSKSIGMQTGVQLGHIILSEFPPKTPAPPPVSQATYGVNSFSKKNVFSYQEDLACFVLPAYGSAKSVFLSGSFNQWSTMQLPMLKTDTGWTACIVLPPGKHLYKYIVDGRWMSDPSNKLKENDGHRGHNSVVFCYNHIFNLQAYTNARRVIVAGSFNGWNRRELQMKKTAEGWTLPIYLREGTHTYKYIVDGNWITDPANPLKRDDGAGNINSVVEIGDPHIFRLWQFSDAERVVLSGSFNAWNTGELVMERYDDGWRLPYVLAAGNYEYKFIVDGRWITDPKNPFTTGQEDFKNSFLAYKPNHIFVLKGYSDAETVIVTGSFNGWSHNDYRMVYRDGEWVFPIHLHPGRYSYKYIVDGAWILDPANSLWEENEFGGGNSVLWVE